MLEGGTELDEILPNGAFWDESALLLEVLDHPGEIPGVGQLQHDVQLVLLDERLKVLDHVRMVELFQEVCVRVCGKERLAL